MRLKLFCLLTVFATLGACKENFVDQELCPYPKVNEKDYSWFRDIKFGIMIHWGPISQEGLELSWSRKSKWYPYDTNSLCLCRTIPSEQYDSLYKTFNPTAYNPDEWIDIFQNAGAKYIVFVAKHHDGFSMFDTKYSNYKITSANSPYKKDIFGMLANSAHSKKMKLGFYYSRPDWYNSDVLTENHSRFVQSVHHQVEELCTNYGKMDFVFFDGGNESFFIDSYSLFNKIKQLQPNCLINDRLGINGEYLNPETSFHKFDRDQLWETNIQLGWSWSWRPVEPIVRTYQIVIRELIKVICQDGNYIVGVGPMPDGRISQRDIDRLNNIGAWLKIYGETIYGTRGGPYQPFEDNIFTSCKGNNFYINIFKWGESENLNLKFFPAKIKKVTVFKTGETLEFSNTNNGFKIKVPKTYRDNISTVIKVETDTTVFNIKPIK